VTHDADLAMVAYMADRIVNDMDQEYAETNPLEPEGDPVFAQWKLDSADIEKLQNKIVDAMEGIQHFLDN
jgi:hypothetical protein